MGWAGHMLLMAWPWDGLVMGFYGLRLGWTWAALAMV
jgi:hypothetical protein